MKIAFVVATFYPRVGGMGEVCYQEAKELSDLGHDVTVFTLSYEKSDYQMDKEMKFKVKRLSALIRLGDAGFAPQLLLYLVGFDVVHLHFPFYGSGFLVFLANVIFNIPYVVTYHMEAKPLGYFKKIIQFFSDKLASKKILERAKKIVLVNKQLQQGSSLLAKFSPSLMVEIPNAIDTDIFYKRNVNSKILNQKDFSGKNILLFVGNLLYIKRLDLILSALQKISDKSFILLVVGGGYENEELKKMVSDLKLDDQVLFLGKILDKNLLAEYYSLADVTIIPSDYESFSLVALESLACGTPLIVSNIKTLSSRIKENKDGFFFSPGDCDDLAKKIIYFFSLSGEDRLKMGESACQNTNTQNSWKKHAQELLKIYLNNS